MKKYTCHLTTAWPTLLMPLILLALCLKQLIIAFLRVHLQKTEMVITVESHFFELPRETIIGSRNREVREIRGKIRQSMSKRNENWFKKLGSLTNRGFEESGIHCILQSYKKHVSH